jgi:hypothetical protein
MSERNFATEFFNNCSSQFVNADAIRDSLLQYNKHTTNLSILYHQQEKRRYTNTQILHADLISKLSGKYIPKGYGQRNVHTYQLDTGM